MRRIILLFVSIVLSASLFGQRTYTLSSDTVIKADAYNIVCAAGTQITMDNGKVVQCVPKTVFVFHNPKEFNYAVAPDKPVRFDSNGNIISFTLNHDAVVETADGQHYSALAGYEVEFYPDGSVKRFTPKFSISVVTSSGKQTAWPAKKEIVFDKNGYVQE